MSDIPMEAAPVAEKAPDAPVRVLSEGLASWLLVSPLAILLAIFLVIPIAVIVTVSFWGYNEWNFYPDFTFENYEYLLTSAVTFDAI